MKKPFHPQAQILGEPPLTWYLFLLFLIIGADAAGIVKLTVQDDYDRLLWGNRGLKEQ